LEGNDIFRASSVDTNVTVDYRGDPARVLVNRSDSAQAVGDVTLAARTARDGYGDSDSFVDIQYVLGTSHGDIVLGSARADVLEGRGGDDGLAGGASQDTLLGDEGNDLLSGQRGTVCWTAAARTHAAQRRRQRHPDRRAWAGRAEGQWRCGRVPLPRHRGVAGYCA
jgi:hypothetical protein